jgi:hypothetical protein
MVRGNSGGNPGGKLSFYFSMGTVIEKSITEKEKFSLSHLLH